MKEKTIGAEPIVFLLVINRKDNQMTFAESRLTEEYHLKNNLYAFVRTYHTPTSVHIDLSLYEKYVECDELHIYSKKLEGKCPTPALAEVYGIISDTDKCVKLWTEYKDSTLSGRRKQ